MKLDLKSDLTILNIFKDDFEYIDCFVETHCKLARSVIMLNTGNQQSYEYTKSLESAYPNLTVLFKEYSDVNFSNFRNDCLLLFPNDTEYYCWVDTDELLIAENNEIDVDAENEAEAQSISNGIDLNDWVAVEDVNFEILSVEEVEDE